MLFCLIEHLYNFLFCFQQWKNEVFISLPVKPHSLFKNYSLKEREREKEPHRKTLGIMSNGSGCTVIRLLMVHHLAE